MLQVLEVRRGLKARTCTEQLSVMGHHYHITMALGSAPILIMLLAAAAGVATAWEELAGVCGAPSGYHAGTAATRCSGLQSHSYRGTAMCTGTYAVEFSDVVYPTASTSGSMTVRLANGAGRFNTEGLLFQVSVPETDACCYQLDSS